MRNVSDEDVSDGMIVMCMRCACGHYKCVWRSVLLCEATHFRRTWGSSTRKRWKPCA